VNLQKQLAASEQEVVKCAGDHEQLSDAHVLLKVSLFQTCWLCMGTIACTFYTICHHVSSLQHMGGNGDMQSPEHLQKR